MLNKLPLATSLLFLVALAAPALADEGWDHRAMQSHHQAVDRAPRQLAPGEVRIGRIEIGAPASTAQVPETLETVTQRQWIQRGSFGSSTPSSGGSAPRVQGGRHNNNPGVSHSSPGR